MIILVKTKPLCIGKAWLPFQKCEKKLKTRFWIPRKACITGLLFKLYNTGTPCFNQNLQICVYCKNVPLCQTFGDLANRSRNGWIRWFDFFQHKFIFRSLPWLAYIIFIISYKHLFPKNLFFVSLPINNWNG